MQDENEMTPADRELEEALSRLTPAKTALGREEMLFRAGQRSMAGRLWIWRGATLSAVAAALAIAFLLHPAALTPSERIVYRDRIIEKREFIPVAASPVVASADEPSAHLNARDFRTRQRILRFGTDAMLTQTAATPVREPLDKAIGIPAADLGVGELLLRQFGQQRGGI